MAVLAVSGSASSPFDQQNGATNGGSHSSLATGSITPSENGELIVIAGAAGVYQPASLTTPYGILAQVIISGGQHYAVFLAFTIQGSAAATNPTITYSASSGSAAAAIASFKAAPAVSSGGGSFVFVG
jgi:hypothetical protein